MPLMFDNDDLLSSVQESIGCGKGGRGKLVCKEGIAGKMFGCNNKSGWW
jgi:hypothetical protein